MIAFKSGERKDDRTQEYLRKWPSNEGVLFVGKVQQKARVMRTQAYTDTATGKRRMRLVASGAMPRAYYFYLKVDDFGPLFIKFCSSRTPAGFASMGTNRSSAPWISGYSVRGPRSWHPFVRRSQGAESAMPGRHFRAHRPATAQVAAASLHSGRSAGRHTVRYLQSPAGVLTCAGLRAPRAGT